jgi:hypothetical protein
MKFGQKGRTLDDKRRKLTSGVISGEGQEEAIFCKNDGFMMLPSLEQDDPRVEKRTLYYICPNCNIKINPKVETTIHGAIVQTRDNAIHYDHKKKIIASVGLRSKQRHKSELDKFINDPIAGITDAPYTTITKRKIVMKGQPNFFIRVDKV